MIYPDKREYILHIIPCCADMEDAMMLNEFRQGIIEDPQLDPLHHIVWGDGDMMPLRYCPSCGKKICMYEENVKEDE